MRGNSRVKPLLKPGVFSLVIPARNAEWNIADLIQDVYAYCSLPAEIIVVANGCDDDTALVAQGLSSGQVPVRVLSFDEPLGPYRAIRMGIEAAQSDIVAVIESDCRIPNVTRSRIRPKLCHDPLGYIVYVVYKNLISVAYPGIVNVEMPHVYQERAITISRISHDMLDIIRQESNMHLEPLRRWPGFKRCITNCFSRRVFAVKKDLFLSVDLQPPFDHHMVWNAALALEWYSSGVSELCFTSTDIIVAHYAAKPPKPHDDPTWPPSDLNLREEFSRRYLKVFEELEQSLFSQFKPQLVSQRIISLHERPLW